MQTQVVAVVIALGVFAALIVVAALIVLLMRRLEEGPRTLDADKLDETTQALLASMPMPAVVYGESMRRTFVNDAYQNNTGLVRRVSRQEWFQRALAEAFLEGAATSRPASAENPEDIHVMALPGNKVVAIMMDQSPRYETAALREDFIANASHELNTPAAAISLLAEAMSRTVEEGSPSAVFAASLVEESERLSALTRDIVRLSQAQAPPSNVSDSVPFDMAALVSDVVESHRELATQMSVKLRVAPSSLSEPTMVVGSRVRMEIALGNLLENAIQYSPAQEVVEVSLTRGDDAVAVKVTDVGPGIPPEFHRQIFQRFYRLDPSRSREVGGTGLGLSIARNTVLNMGGDIRVDSNVGEGAAFTISVPLQVENLGLFEGVGPRPEDPGGKR